MSSKDQPLIEALINTEDRIRHNKAILIIFYGKEMEKRGRISYFDNEYSREIKKRVRILYSGPKYAGYFDDIYTILVSSVCRDLVSYLKKHPETAVHKSLLGLIVKMVGNSSYRKEVDDYLWNDPNRSESVRPNERMPGDGIGSERGYWEVVENPSHQKNPSDEDDIEGEIKTRRDWAADYLDKYIKMLPKEDREKYLEVIMSKYESGLSSAEYAKQIGTTEDNVNTMRNRAILALIQVALPDIRKRAKSMFARFSDELTSIQVSVLRDFLEAGNLGDNANRKRIAQAYKALVKISNRESKKEAMEFEKGQRVKERLEKAAKK